MVSESVKKISGKSDLKQAWNALFQYHNQQKNQKSKAIFPGEKIFIKINQGTASWVMSKEEKENGYTISSCYENRSAKKAQITWEPLRHLPILSLNYSESL